jgi:hypothetical protein
MSVQGRLKICKTDGAIEGIMAEQSENGGTTPGKMELAQKPAAKARGKASKGEIELRTPSQIAAHSGEIEIAETYSEAGIRPISVSHLEVFGTILNGRPIAASHLHVMDYSLPGQRPVFASDMIIRDALTLPGGRPVIASDPHLMEASLLPGGRPIASNEIDDSETLMGFID